MIQTTATLTVLLARLMRAEAKGEGECFHPATRSLWFYMEPDSCPAQWYGQWNSGRYKAHCFFAPTEFDCPFI